MKRTSYFVQILKLKMASSKKKRVDEDVEENQSEEEIDEDDMDSEDDEDEEQPMEEVLEVDLISLFTKFNKKCPIFIFTSKSFHESCTFSSIYICTLNRLKDYQLKLGISDSNLCECDQIETVEHYLLHCEKYFNEREALRTHILKAW